jgi:hypothetical protein
MAAPLSCQLCDFSEYSRRASDQIQVSFIRQGGKLALFLAVLTCPFNRTLFKRYFQTLVLYDKTDYQLYLQIYVRDCQQSALAVANSLIFKSLALLTPVSVG